MNLKPQLKSTLSSDQLRILHLVADEASQSGLPLYIIGGSVRDLILGAATKDLDLTVEGDAIALARALAKRHGGRVTAHSKFGTANWFLPKDLATESRDSVDLISARSETYKHPAALPTVKTGTMDDDIRRRDFTINTLAIRLDGSHFGELRDDLGGMDDLKQGIVRVLHAKILRGRSHAHVPRCPLRGTVRFQDRGRDAGSDPRGTPVGRKTLRPAYPPRT